MSRRWLRSGVTAAAGVVAVAGLVLAGPSVAVVPPASGNNAVITVRVGGDRSGVSNVTGVAGATLGLFDTATAATPVAGFGTCVSDADGDCSFTVPNTQLGAPNRDRRFWVKQLAAPAGYVANASLATGPGPVTSTPYRFQTGTELRAGSTYSSQSDFMFSTGTNNNTASGGVWQNSRANPTLPPQCGLHLALVTDLSNSVGADLVNLKAAANTLIQSLVGTPSTVSLFTFATQGPAAGASNVNRPGLNPVSTQAGVNTVQGYVNALTLPGGNDGGTNWDRGLAQVAEASQHYDITVVITDGNPTFYGRPTQGPGSRTRFAETENGIYSANAIKAQGTRMLAMGVGAGVSGPPDNLRAISGPTLNSDYYQSSDYAAAGAALRALALGQCAGSVSVIKQVIPSTAPPGSITGAQPAGGWTFAATSATTGLGITPAAGQTAAGTGALSFALTFPGGVSSAPLSVTETQQPGYTLQQVGGDNAVCTRLDTGAAVPVANNGAAGFTVTAASTFPVSCTVYNRAPDPLATIQVGKTWVVNGSPFADGTQPPGLLAQLSLNGTTQGWDVPRGGFVTGDTVTISETTSITGLPLCTLVSSRLTAANGAPVDQALPFAATLTQPTNTYQITNTVTCSTRLSLVKIVDGGTATPDQWTLTGTGPPGTLPGPSGTTGVTADVTPDATYTLSESGGDPRYVPDLDPNATPPAGATGSWVCVQLIGVGGLTGRSAPLEAGLNGQITVPLGTATSCSIVNRTAALTLIKRVINSHGGTAVPADWTLTGTPTAPVPPGLTPVSVPGSTAGQTAQIRPNQPYALSEAGPPGYAPSDWTCSDNVIRAGSQISVLPGAEATCSITNNDIGPTLTLVKTVDNGSTGATTPATAWTLTAAGPSTISGVTGSGAVTAAAAQVGTYDLAETGPAGYTATGWTCTGATAATGTSVTLALSDHATCTIHNTAVGPTLTLVKTVDNGSTGATTPATAWTLTAAGPSTISGVTGSGAVTAAAAQVGTYDLAETGPAGYTATGWTCTGATAATGTSVTLALSDHATCTIHNTAVGPTLTLVKTVDNGSTGATTPATAWTLTAAGPSTISGVTGSGAVTAAAAQVGTYDLAETGPAGYTATGWTCTGATAATGTSVTLALSDHATCTIHNTAVGPTLTLVKTVDNGSTGATTPATAWTLTAAGPSTISGVTGSGAVTAAAAQVGTYDLAETGPAGYTATGWTCTGATAATGTSVTLALSDHATCTIHNTATDPRLTLIKKVHNTHGGTAVPTDWTLTAAGPTPINGTTGEPAITDAIVQVGDYTLTEAGPTGYTATGWSCTGASVHDNIVAITIGAQVTCTITNNDTETAIAAPTPPPSAQNGGESDGGTPNGSTGDNNNLPVTGDAARATLTVALAAVVAGTLLLAAARRRRRRSD